MSGVSRDEKEYNDCVLVEDIKQLVKEQQQIAYIDKLLKRVEKPFKGRKKVVPEKSTSRNPYAIRKIRTSVRHPQNPYAISGAPVPEVVRCRPLWKKKAKRKLIFVDMHTKTPWP